MSLKRELRDSISSLTLSVQKTFVEVKSQYEEMKTSLQFMSDKYDNLFKTLQSVEEEKLKDKKYISQLEDKVDFLERKLKSSGLEMRNVRTQSLKNWKQI